MFFCWATSFLYEPTGFVFDRPIIGIIRDRKKQRVVRKVNKHSRNMFLPKSKWPNTT